MAGLLSSISSSTLTILGILLNTIYLIFHYIRPLTTRHSLFRQGTDIPNAYRPWAFITGSSSGIGYGIAQSLLRQNFDVVLHGRDPTRLQNAVDQLSRIFPHRQIKSICFDVSTSLTANNLTQDVLNALTPLTDPALSNITLRLLVNNIGVAFDPNSNIDFSPFTTQPLSHILRNIDVNVRFTTLLAYHLLPVLRQNAQNSSGGSTSANNSRSMIVNISSLATIGIPYFAVYSGAKAYMTVFTRALDTELKAEKWPVDVKVVESGDVDTPGHRVGTNLFTPTAHAMGEMVVNAVMDGRSGVVLYPFWGHWLQVLACKVQPFWLLQKGLILNLKQTLAQKESKAEEKKG